MQHVSPEIQNTIIRGILSTSRSYHVNYFQPSFMLVCTVEISTIHFSYDRPNSLNVFEQEQFSNRVIKRWVRIVYLQGRYINGMAAYFIGHLHRLDGW